MRISWLADFRNVLNLPYPSYVLERANATQLSLPAAVFQQASQREGGLQASFDNNDFTPSSDSVYVGQQYQSAVFSHIGRRARICSSLHDLFILFPTGSLCLLR